MQPDLVHPRIRLAPGVLFRQEGDRSALLNLASRELIGLDAMATAMLAAVLAAPSIEDAADRLLAEYEVGAARLDADLHGLVDMLGARGLIEVLP